MKTNSLYFIGLVPPEPTQSALQQMKNDLFQQYGLKHALKSPPHITLHMPFQLKEKRTNELDQVLISLTAKRSSFNVELNGFRHFNERVLYVHVEDQPQLTALHQDMKRALRRAFQLDNADYKNRGFNPHITIAFRDMKKSLFRQIWPEYEQKRYNARFEAGHFTLFIHQNKKWETYKEYLLEG